MRMTWARGSALAMAMGGFALAAPTVAPAAAETFINIGTGGQTGVYYVVGQSICRLVNRETAKHNLKCTAPSTGGSIANLNAIAAGEQTMGVVQSDWQYHAYNGSSQFEGKANKKLRAVFSVHPEPFTVVARVDSGITSFDQLKGKRVNVGNPGSGARGTFEVVMDKLGWKMGDFSLAAELKSAEQSAALCDNNIDVIVFTVGHPSGTIKEATTACDSRIVSVTGPKIDELVNENPYYAKATIPGVMYRGTDKDVTTFGVLGTFVSSTDVSEETVYQVVKAVFDNFDRFKRLHPAFEILEPKKMISDGLSAPLHPGAVKYYKEKGWM